MFEELARALAEALGVDAVMIGVFTDEGRSRMRTLATWLDGRTLRPFEYDLAKTPCAGVVGREFRFVGQGVQPEFRPGTMFQALGFDSYAAYALNDAAGVQLGLIAALDRGAMTDRELAESLLQDIRRARGGGARAHARRGGAAALGSELPLDLRGERGPDLRPRLGQRPHPRRQSEGGRGVRLLARGDAATLGGGRERERAAVHGGGGRAPNPGGQGAAGAGAASSGTPGTGTAT